jgi:hypothetical protein
MSKTYASQTVAFTAPNVPVGPEPPRCRGPNGT